MEPSDRYGVGLFLHKNGLGGDAREWFLSLRGTSYETSSNRYLGGR
jgi:hypothetical protein